MWGAMHGFLLPHVPVPPIPVAVSGWHDGRPLQPIYDAQEVLQARLQEVDCDRLNGDARPMSAGTIRSLSSLSVQLGSPPSVACHVPGACPGFAPPSFPA